jgi:Zn-dependent peptidase ImmA (M78 family)
MAAKKQKKNQQPFCKVRIGYQDVSVYLISPEDDGRLEDSEGFYQSSKAMICINDRQCASEQFATLMHETLHGIFYTYGMREIITDKEDEEFIVNTMAGALIQVLRDNPILLKGIKKL